MSEWNAVLYDSKHDFVAEYGKELLEFVPKNKNQSILDLGCGTGTLTSQLVNYADTIVGVDSSENMIEMAQKQYADIKFIVCDAVTLFNDFDQPCIEAHIIFKIEDDIEHECLFTIEHYGDYEEGIEPELEDMLQRDKELFMKKKIRFFIPPKMLIDVWYIWKILNGDATSGYANKLCEGEENERDYIQKDYKS